MNLRTITAFLLLALAGAAPSPAQSPVGSTFSYQGELRQSGSPVTGAADFRFRLFDSAAGGLQIGTELTVNNAALTAGRFNAALDFGAAAFGPDARFLEIDVRSPAGSGSFVTLTPRQRVSAAPVAQFALEAAIAATALNATSATQLNGQGPSFYQNAGNLSSGTIPSARVSGAYSNALTLSNPGNVIKGNGAGVTGVDADRLDGLDSAAFLQAVPVPLAVSGGDTDGLIRAINSSATSFSPGVYGENTATAVGAFAGGRFVSQGTTATGVWGESLGSLSSGGMFLGGSTGLSARATNPGVTGGRGVSAICDTGSSGSGVFALVTTPTSQTFGVRAESESNQGTGVFGLASALTGATVGVWGKTSSASGTGVLGESTVLFSGTPIGVQGRVSASAGIGGVFKNNSFADRTVELAGPSGAINTTGFLSREYTVNTPRCAIPIAYGNISSVGAINSGTGNFTVAHTVTGEYEITISGETFSNAAFTVNANVSFNLVPFCATVADGGASLRICVWNLSTNAKADAPVHFTVFKTNPN